ncbi:hypothetical protein KI688_005864 [Linnemannia hyalina]|uniref:Uncharacterized protein n=1 Tax=Linnemannia hyalina TaxID=64524 RepID=A0A9P8BXW0_9FUNG|nr:hypothetical protein KI688_005864 [Linnemannia hyalina]
MHSKNTQNERYDHRSRSLQEQSDAKQISWIEALKEKIAPVMVSQNLPEFLVEKNLSGTLVLNRPQAGASDPQAEDKGHWQPPKSRDSDETESETDKVGS